MYIILPQICNERRLFLTEPNPNLALTTVKFAAQAFRL